MNHPDIQSPPDYSVPPARWSDPLRSLYWRAAASGWMPARRGEIPPESSRRALAGPLRLEIVSHCWNYAHLLIYQLSSLINFPPVNTTVTMTVFYCREDKATCDLLAHFGKLDVVGVDWNWRELPREALFRRAIGRNLAALETKADWVWFTDCDLLFRDGCLDGLAHALQGRRDALVFPRVERCTTLLTDESPILNTETQGIEVVDVDTSQFSEYIRSRATGPLQITHGDVARSSGYCASVPYYQRPSPVWCKAHEDRAFRWLLGSQGTPLDIPGVYRIRHAAKGRYQGGLRSRLRGWIRRLRAP